AEAIAAQNDAQIAAFGNFFAWQSLRVCVRGGMLVASRRNRMLRKPVQQFWDDLLRRFRIRLCNDSRGLNLRHGSPARVHQKLLVAFRSRDRTFDDLRYEPQSPYRLFHTPARCIVQLRLAHDAALADLSLADFELGLDQYNHLSGGL